MTTRNGRSVWQVWYVLGLWCLSALAAPAAVRGEGSISFNGSSGSGTSKLQHTSANLTDGSGQMTICAWVYPDGLGEANTGVIAALDKDSSGIRIEHDDANKLAVRANWSLMDGWWTFPVTDDAWNAVAVTYDNSATSKDPAARVNYATASVDEEDTPNGTAASANSGYCIGNLADQTRTWEGRIAHVQVFNRILSAAEMDAALITPGSVRNGLRMWLPMADATDIYDRSGNGFDGAATDLGTGVNSPQISRQQGIEAGTILIPPGYTTVTQLVVPRYANGTSPPGGQLRGVGPASVLRANSATASLADGTRAVAMTEDYAHANGVAFYQRTGAGPTPAVLRPIIRDLTIAGHDETGTSYANRGLIDDQPGSYHLTTGTISGATNASPIVITTNVYPPATGSRVTITNVGGNTAANNTWIVTQGSTTAPYTFSLNGSTGNGSYTSGGSWTLQDLYHGALVLGSGTKVENVTFYYIPGTPLIMKGGTGSKNGQLGEWDSEKSRLWDCHFLRCYRGPEIGLVDAVVGKLEGEGLRDYGIKFTAGSAQIDGYMHFYGVSPGPCMWFPYGAGGCQGSGPFYVENAPIGMLIDNENNDFTNIYSHTCTDKNIHLTTASGNCRLTNLWIRVYSSTKGIVNQGFFNTVSSAKFKIESSTGTGIQLLGNGGADHGTVLDNIYVEGQGANYGVGIKVDCELNDTRITGHVKNVLTGVDFSSGSLGERNTIYLTADGTNTDVALLPASWNATNDIKINGMKVKGRVTAAADDGTGDWRINSANHGLSGGEKIAFQGARGTGFGGLNCTPGQTFTITKVDDNYFDVEQSTVSGTHAANTGWWGVWQK